MLYKNITIIGATRDHGGKYTCVSTNNCDQKKAEFIKIFKGMFLYKAHC